MLMQPVTEAEEPHSWFDMHALPTVPQFRGSCLRSLQPVFV